MGKEKKHKRHKYDRRERYEDVPSSRPSSLKLVLKVGGGTTPEYEPRPISPPPSVAPLRFSMAAITEAETHRKEKKHKKKKKKDKEKDRERHRHRKERRHLEAAWSGGLEESSRLSSGTEPLSQGTGSSPEPASVPPPPADPEPDADVRAPERPPAVPVSAPVSASAPHAAAAAEETLAEAADRPAAAAAPSAAVYPASAAALPIMSPALVLDRVTVPPPPPPPPTKTPLQRFLEYLLRGLEKKDPQRFFVAPVTDALAPGYSSVIHHPMDFGTMLHKVDTGSYSSLADFQEDFGLMCSNAMAYNRPDTIYYKAARRLLHIGSKMMSPDKLASLRTVVPAMAELGPDVLGFHVTPAPSRGSPVDTADTTDGLPSLPEPVDEEAEAEEILQQAQAAARRAAEKLAARKTTSKLGYLRQRADGSTSLVILTDADEELSEEKPVAPWVLTGRLSQGAAHPASLRDDKRNVARPVRPVLYGPYSSLTPGHDPAFASISLEESELLAQTYGDDTCQQYAQSVRQFADGCHMATELMDNLLDILTDGRHRRAQHVLEQHRQLAIEERVVSAALTAAVATPTAPAAPQVDFSSLKSLSSLGIDVGFLDALESEERRRQEAHARLEPTADLVTAAGDAQRRRLGQPSESSLTLSGSQQDPQSVGDAPAGSVADPARQAQLGDAAAAGSLRRTPGCGMATSSPDNPSSHEEVDVEAVSTAATPEVRRVDSPPVQPGLHELLADV